MSFSHISEIIKLSESQNLPFWKIIILDDMKERNVSGAVNAIVASQMALTGINSATQTAQKIVENIKKG